MFNTINKLTAVMFLQNLSFTAPISVLFLLAKGLSLAEVLTLSSVVMISAMVFEIPTGVFADRYGRKWSVVLSLLIHIGAWVLWFFINSFLGLVAIYVIFGLSSSFWSGADEALIYDELKTNGKEKISQRVFSKYYAVAAVAFAVAALVGGLIIPEQKLEFFYLPFWMSWGALCLGLVVALFIKEQPYSEIGDESINRESNMFRQFGIGWDVLRHNSKLLRIFLFSIFTTSFALFELYQPYFVQSHVATHWFGYALAISSVLTAIVKWYAYKIEEWFGVETGALIMSVIPGLIWMMMAFIFNPVVAIILFVLSDAMGNLKDPILADYRNRHIQGKKRATVLSTLSLVSSGYFVIMYPIVGWVAQKSLPWAFILLGGIILVSAVLFRIRSEDVVVAN